ncbi:DNA repair protein RAD51 [Tieghemiomyces parasiticus]|uniref:DNA repair protein RAD51 n=1 Tax=Tieghemiomyces parasiticus TaxID=78921 RepID=A0A9W8DVR2_9FUNG|nr:DNA repair protein RAD51 [Tieghemiomyces parasiticus]
MAQRPLQRLPPAKRPSESALALLRDHRPRPVATCRDLLGLTKTELAEICDLKTSDAAQLYQRVCSAVYAVSVRVQNVKDLYHSQMESRASIALSSGHHALDAALGGGIPRSSVTEVVGAPGCGKTQLCLTLTVRTALPLNLGGTDGHVLYFDTEGAFSATRLQEITAHIIELQGAIASPDLLATVTDRVHVASLDSVQQFRERLRSLEGFIVQHKIKLILVDSIAFIMRRHLNQRASEEGGPLGDVLHKRPRLAGDDRNTLPDLLTWEASSLKHIAETFSIPVVVTNQVTTRFARPRVLGVPSMSDIDVHEDGLSTSAALGNTWAHLVTTRLTVRTLASPETGGRPSPASTGATVHRPIVVARAITIAKSPIAPACQFPYVITPAGFGEALVNLGPPEVLPPASPRRGSRPSPLVSV